MLHEFYKKTTSYVAIIFVFNKINVLLLKQKYRYRRMFDKSYRIVSAKICFFIFFMKMLISATPIFINNVDQGTILQVIMQLEVENTAKNSIVNNEDLHEPVTYRFIGLYSSAENDAKQNRYLKNEKSICSFHPSVPTPPPNS